MKTTRLLKDKMLALALTLPLANAALSDDTSTMEIDDLGMHLSKSELRAVESAVNSAREISRIAESRNGRPYRRDAHAKATGCVRATLSVNGDIPEQFQHSIFQSPSREYQAWIRFSNGDMLVQADKHPDARGMAIKVMGVEGEPIAPELAGPKTQDFIMTNSSAFFNRDIFDYADNAKYLEKLDRTGWFIGLLPPHLHPKQFYRAVQTVSTVIDNPLHPQYYSMLPYRLGTTDVKFSVKRCPGSDQLASVLKTESPAPADENNFDYLTQNMASSLETGGACFDFMLQEKKIGADMPIDDATVIWSEKDSPFVPIARLHIPPQTFTGEAQQQFCENLSMNPWHGVGDWEPQGSLNKARRVVYNAVSKFRHHKNRVPRSEPSDWCIAGQDCPQQSLIVTKSRWPLPRCFDELYQPLDGQTVDSQCQSFDDDSASNAAY